MNLVKVILAVIGLAVAAIIALSVVGIIYTAVWYLFLLGVVAIGGAVGYKFLKKQEEPAKLENNVTVKIAEMKNADRTLEEYKRKYLPK